MTDPQDDVPCRDCKRPTQHATERCDDCRTPAGRLVTALRETLPDIEGIEAEYGRSVVGVGCLTIEVDEDGRWTIEGHADDGIAPEDAIAAIVQAPGLRAERDTLAAENARLREANLELSGSIEDVDAEAAEQADHWIAEVAERDAEIARLVAELEKCKLAVNAWESVPGLYGFTRYDNPRSRLPQTLQSRASVKRDGWIVWDIFGDKIASGPETGDAGRHAADLALVKAGYRLIGGVHPAQGEVKA